MDFSDNGQYGETTIFDLDIPDDVVKEMLWDMASRSLGTFLRQGADRIEKIRLFVGERCALPAFGEDGDDIFGCHERPHRHCGWKAIVVA